MSFFSRFRSRDYSVVTRKTPGGVLVARRLRAEIDFTAEVLDETGLLVPEDALGRLEDLTADLFHDKLLIDQNDPHADDIMKLKRIKAADPVLFDNGTSGPQLSFFYGRHVEEWLARERWNAAPDDVSHVKIVLATIKLGEFEYFYDLA